MRSIIRSRPMLAAAAVIALGSVPAAVSLLQAQVVRCYIEVCVPTEGGGERCYQKLVDCPKEPI
jgi:hypothetical protein